MDMSSSWMRRVMPWEKGVSTTQGSCGNSALMSLATVKASLSALPGMQITKSMAVADSTFLASSVVHTRVNEGG